MALFGKLNQTVVQWVSWFGQKDIHHMDKR